MLTELTPSTHWQLIAFHEWSGFVQGAWCGINSFDQFGVELGKELAGSLGPDVAGQRPIDPATDAATAATIAWYRNITS